MPPLLFGVALDQLLVDGATRHVQDVFLKVGRAIVRDTVRLNRRARLFRSVYAEECVEGVHVEGHVV